MTINSSQITACWHVNDLMVSHKDEISIDAFFLKICKIFGNGTKFSRGKVHEYMVMDMDWSQDGIMIVSIIKYLQKIIHSTSITYASEYLFIARYKKDRELLPEEQSQHFHRNLSLLFFMCMRSCPGIQALVDFLTTIVRYPNEDDWGEAETGGWSVLKVHYT